MSEELDRERPDQATDGRPPMEELLAGASGIAEAYNVLVGNQTEPLAPLIDEAVRRHEPHLLALLSLADAELSLARCYGLDMQPQREIRFHGLHRPTVDTVEPYSAYWRRRPTADTYFALGASLALAVSTRRELHHKELAIDLEALRDPDPSVLRQPAGPDISRDRTQRQIVFHGLHRPTFETVQPGSPDYVKPAHPGALFIMRATGVEVAPPQVSVDAAEPQAIPIPLDMENDPDEVLTLIPQAEREQFVGAYNTYKRGSISYFEEACMRVAQSTAGPIEMMTVLNALHPQFVRFSPAKRQDRLLSRLSDDMSLLPDLRKFPKLLEHLGFGRSARARAREDALTAVLRFADGRTEKVTHWRNTKSIRTAMTIGEHALAEMLGRVPDEYPNAAVINELRSARLDRFARHSIGDAHVPSQVRRNVVAHRAATAEAEAAARTARSSAGKAGSAHPADGDFGVIEVSAADIDSLAAATGQGFELPAELVNQTEIDKATGKWFKPNTGW